jgi:hypothetical protein
MTNTSPLERQLFLCLLCGFVAKKDDRIFWPQKAQKTQREGRRIAFPTSSLRGLCELLFKKENLEQKSAKFAKEGEEEGNGVGKIVCA